MAFPQSLHIFCRVIDNFGDIGVCWRLSKQFALEHGMHVTLWVDDLASLKKICANIDPLSAQQQVRGVRVRTWPVDTFVFTPDEVAEFVIEAFGCELPNAYVAAMALRERAPAWVNLEYLSAEVWVEGCHALPSPHRSLPLTKYFFFPGFTDRTGGLPLERDLFLQRDAFQQDPAVIAAFLAGLGVHAPAGSCKVSLFCYPSAPVSALLEAMQVDVQPVLCLVPEGVATDAVSVFLQQPATAGAKSTRDALTLQVIPFVEQENYDRLLWACDMNFVRGEDSFVRAQWAARPFIWQIYRQDQEVHMNKLSAFLERYTGSMQKEASAAVNDIFLAWNSVGANAGAMHEQWCNFHSVSPQLTQYGRGWAQRLSQHGDLASNLFRYMNKIC